MLKKIKTMEIKKNPKKDLNHKSGLHFAVGMLLILMLTYVALEWKSFYDVPDYDTSMNQEEELDEESPLIFITPPPPPPPPVAPTVIEVVVDDEPIEETFIDTSESDEEKEVLKYEDIDVDEVEEEVDVNWVTIEEVPIFPGCENEKDKRACFNEKMKKHVQKNFRYPELAQEMGFQGKVQTQFTIQKNGVISEIRLRGPHKILEDEAQRILGKLPKMTPGKQRDQNVKVSFTIPIYFKLQ